MLEIPESRTISSQLEKMIKGKTVKKVVANMTPHGCAFFSCDPNYYQEMLLGKTVLHTKDVSGLVEIKIDDTLLIFGDGANIRYFYPEDKRPKKHQLCVRFTDNSSIVCTVKYYGGLWAYNEDKILNGYYVNSKEKPHPLCDDFNEEYLDRLMWEHKNKSIKRALYSEQSVPGLGNGSLQEILYNAKLNYKTKVSKLSSDDFDRLFKSIKSTLKEMCDKNGRNTEYDLFGKKGNYITKVSRYTFNKPCPNCNDLISRKQYLGTNVYYCPTCQPVAR